MAPQLRNLVQRQLYRDIGVGIVLGVIAGLGWKYGYAEPKRRKFEEFYKTYDVDKDCKILEANLDEIAAASESD